MIREMEVTIIDAFEDFLESKGIEIINPEKTGDEGEAIIYGSDFDEVETDIRNCLKGYGIYPSSSFIEEFPERTEDECLIIFVPSQGEFVKIEVGTGDNLLKEDIADGYVDYLNWDRYDPADLGVSENNLDGGMLMLKKYVSEAYTSLIDVVPAILKEAYDNDDMSFVVIKGGKAF